MEEGGDGSDRRQMYSFNLQLTYMLMYELLIYITYLTKDSMCYVDCVTLAAVCSGCTSMYVLLRCLSCTNLTLPSTRENSV